MAHADAHEHDDHGHAVVDGDDLPHHGPVIEEPRSPAWLPFLGLALFGVLIVWWLSTPNEAEEARAAAAASASASASAEAPPQPAAQPPQPAQPQPGAQFPRPQPQAQPPQPQPNNAPGANQPAMQVKPGIKIGK